MPSIAMCERRKIGSKWCLFLLSISLSLSSNLNMISLSFQKKKTKSVPGIVILVTFQLFYTGIATFISYVVYRWQWINVAWLIFLLTTATWNGATFYFEAMIERERKEQARLDAQKEEEESKEKRKLLQVASTWGRLLTFLLFVLLWVVVDLYVLHPYIMQ